MKKTSILNLLLLLIILTSISTYSMWISRLRQSSSYIRPQFVPAAQQRTYAQQPRHSRTQTDWEKSWGSKQQTQWQQPEYQYSQKANQDTQSTEKTWGEWFKSMWYGTIPIESQQYTQSNQTKQKAKSSTFFGYGPTGKALKNFITLLPEGTTVENWQEKFYAVTKENHPDRIDALIVSKKISPEEGNARKAHYTNVISAYNAWKQAKLKAE